jgi:ribose transport system substrate-binding protein
MQVTSIKMVINKLAFLFIVIGMLTGCTESPASKLPPSGHTPITTSTALTLDKNNATALTFGILYPMAHPFYEEITELVEQAAKPHSIQLIIKAPDEVNLEQQILMMETMIKQKVDGIAISPIDTEALAPIIDKAIKSGIPVICFESDVPTSQRLAFFGTDPVREGTLMGEIVAGKLKDKGMIIVEAGMTKSMNQQSRLAGMVKYLEQTTEIQVLEIRYNEGSSDRALADLEAMIKNHPHFDALVTLDVTSSSASILVWKAQGLKRNALTIGMTPEVNEALQNGQITSVISENEQMWGKSIIDLLLLASEGKPLPDQVDPGTQMLTDLHLK